MAISVARVTNNFSQCNFCHTKLSEDLIKKCSRCKIAIYCGTECQKSDWTAVHKTECIAKEPYRKENEDIRQNFSNSETLTLTKIEKYNHVFQTQKAILAGSGHLNSETSVVVVCGAQFYDEDKFVEPLPQLLEKCKRLILLDVDPVTLENLHLMLGNSSKVSKVVLDLTCALKELPGFHKKASSPEGFILGMCDFLDKVTIDTEKRAAGLPGVLGVLSDAESADYVISSLVGSQLSIRLKEMIFELFSKKFGSHISSAMTSELLDKAAEVLKKNMHALTTKHTEDLCAWAGQEGRVYFADAYKFNQINIVLADKTLKDLTQILDKKKKSSKLAITEWHWIANRSHDYSVISILS